TLTARNLFFDATVPASGKVLNTQIDQLDLNFGIPRNLTVVDSNQSLVLGSINAGGFVDIQSTTGGLFDANVTSPGPTYVTGTTAKVRGATLGTLGNQIDTDASFLDLTSTNGGDTHVVEKDSVTVSAASAAGALDIATADGSMTVAAGISGGDGVTL